LWQPVLHKVTILVESEISFDQTYKNCEITVQMLWAEPKVVTLFMNPQNYLIID
jgi:hypothetical protein